MLLFNGILQIDLCRCLIFKNILCYCSTTTGILTAFVATYLKTSYVIVQPGTAALAGVASLHLKTSYVIVQLESSDGTSTTFTNLKTSYVIVQRSKRPRDRRSKKFKNILCYCSTIRMM